MQEPTVLKPNDKGQLFDNPNLTVDQKLKHIYREVLETRQILTACFLEGLDRSSHPLDRLGISREFLEDLKSEIRNRNQRRDI